MSDLIIPDKQFVHLHNHSEFSLLDGLSRTADMAKRAKELGMPAIALTDHGRMSGLVEFYDNCKKEGVKPILGMEAYMTPLGHHRSERVNYDVKDMRGKPGHERMNYHVNIWAATYQGYKNLCALSTASYAEGYYYKPRIDFELLCEHKEGLVVSSACILGAINHYLYCDDYQKARETALRFQDAFGDDFYMEIMNHELDMEKKIMPEIRRLAAEIGVKVIATNDAHFVRKEDHKLQKTMMLMGMHKSWSDPDIAGFYYDDDNVRQRSVESGEDNDSDPIFEMPPHLYLKDYDEMMEVLLYGGGEDGVAEQELANTLEVAEKCNCELPIIDPEDMSAYHTPIYPIDQDFQYDAFIASNFQLRKETEDEILRELAEEGKTGKLTDLLSEHEYESLRFLMWMCENGIEKRIRPKLEAKGEPLPTEYWCENPPDGLKIEHAHNSPDELWIKEQLAEGKTIADMIRIYQERLDYEVGVVVRKGFLDYFSVVSSYTRWTKEQGSLVGAGRGCLTPDNVLFTETGHKTIDKITVEDKVYDEKGILCDVEHIYEYDVNERLVDINIYNSDHIVLTPDHKVKVSKCIRNTPKHEKDAVFIDKEPVTEAQWIPADDIEHGDWVYIPIIGRDKDEQDHVFDLADYIPTEIAQRCTITGDSIEYMQFFNQFSNKDAITQRKVSRETGLSRNAIRSFIHGKQKTSETTIRKLNEYLKQFNTTAYDWKQSYQQGSTIVLPRYIVNSAELGYLFGYYIADGWVHRGALCMAYHDDDIAYQNKMRKAMQKVFGVSPLFHKRFKNKKLTEGTVQNTIISNFFKSVVPQTVESKKIPDVFMHASDDIVKALIEGLVDGDGHIDYSNSRASYDTISQELAYQIKYLLNTFGVSSSIHTREYFKHPNWHRSYKIRISTNHLFEEIYNQKEKTNSPFSVTKDGCICCRVHSTSSFNYQGKVYDLKINTDNEPSYLTTGCIVHNSGAGALLNYLLDITSIDPIPNGLLFQRFLNPERKGYPDIDLDFAKDFRDNQLKPYLRSVYGEDCAAAVATYMYLWGKAAIRAAGRVLFNPPESLDIADQLCEALDDKPKLDLNTQLDGSNPAFEAIANSSKKHRQVLDLALEMQGRVSGESIHASAFILSPFPILDQMPLVVTKDERKLAQETGKPIKEYLISYDGVITQDKLGFVKLDLLCLKDLEMMDMVCRTVERIYGCKLNLENLPLDDKAVFDLVLAGNNSGVFQFDGSPVALRILQESGADRIADWSAVNALNRPGPLQMGYDKEFIVGKKDPSHVTYFAPAAESQLKETYGTICIAEGQEVETNRGKVPIEQVSVGDRVLDEQGNWHNVSHFFDNGHKGTVKIRTSFGKELICTPDHKIMTQDGWKEAQDLTTSDLVKCVNPYKARKELAQREDFNWEEWLIGLFVADGNSAVSTPNIACCNEDFARSLVDIVREHVFPDMEGIVAERHDTPHGSSTWYVMFYQKHGNNGYFSKDYKPNQMNELLKKYDLFHKTGINKHLPENYTYPMLVGMFEGDGCYTNKRLHIKYEHLAKEYYEALLHYGVNASVYRNSDCSWTVAIHGDIRDIMPAKILDVNSRANCNTSKDVYIPREYVWEMNDSESLMPIKTFHNYQKYDCPFVTLDTATKMGFTPSKQHHMEWGKVLSVEDHGIAHVYDITVDDVHKFVCQDIVVSNCYQEQIMLLSQDPTIVGFTGGQADTLRKATAKKKADKVEAICSEAREVAKKNHTDPKVTEYFLEAAKASGSYSFNKSHSLAYAVVAYRGAFLKAHFPECFLAAMCTIKPQMKKVNKVPEYLEEARQMGVTVKPPHVNYSMEGFDVPEKGVIAFGLGGIKRVGKGAAPIIAEREANGPYKDFTDFCTRVPREVGKAPLEALIKAGACDGLGWSRMAMEESIDQIIDFRKNYFKEKEKKDLFEDDLFGFGGGDGAQEEDDSTSITLVAPFDTEYSELVLMRKERDEFGMYFDKDPRDFCQVSRFMLERELQEEQKERIAKGDYDFPRFVNVNEIAELPDRTQVGFIANVEDLREFNTKKGSRMASMYVWDNGTNEESRFGFSPTKSKIKCTIFSRVLENITKPFPDDVVYVTGRVSVDAEGNWPTAVLVDSVEIVAPDSQWLGAGASMEKMQEFAQAQADMQAYNKEVGDPTSSRYMIPAVEFRTTDDLDDFMGDLRINKLYLKDGNVQVSAEDDPNGEHTKILHLKQTMGMVKLAAEYGGIAKKIRHPKAQRALDRKAMMEGTTAEALIEQSQQ